MLVIKGLSGILQKATQVLGFQHHWRCHQTSITHLCFVNDHMVFCHIDTISARVIKSFLGEFERVSSLGTNSGNSHLSLSRVSEKIQV